MCDLNVYLIWTLTMLVRRSDTEDYHSRNTNLTSAAIAAIHRGPAIRAGAFYLPLTFTLTTVGFGSGCIAW